ncbi:MAG: SRPBCC family protein [Bdellovibrio sp.]|nr:SRPBCC family protein [Bdellovibrio sp.]
MLINFLAIVGAILALFLGYVAVTKSGKFHYERSGVIQTAPDVIFPYLARFTLGGEWSPYEKTDPDMKKYLAGEDGEVGSTMVFEGNSKAGSGKLELLRKSPNEEVLIRFTMIKPFKADNLVIYRLMPESDGTRFTWSMSGDGGFMHKIMVTLIDCDKLIGDQFDEGIQNLKTIMEAKQK